MAETELEDLVPPCDKKAEQSLLGSLMRQNDLVADVLPIVRTDDFYVFAHQKIFESIVAFAMIGHPIDPVLLLDDLTKKQFKEEIGGPAYLVSLWESAPAAANAVHYAEIIRDKAKLRRLINVCSTLHTKAWDQRADATEILLQAEEAIFSLSANEETKAVAWGDATQETLELLDRRSGQAKDGETDGGWSTGWTKLDHLTGGGLHKKELTILAARPSVGKTLAGLCLMQSITNQGGKVYFASIEQGRAELVQRDLSRTGNINSHRFRSGKFESEEEVSRFWEAVETVRSRQIWVNDSSLQSVNSIASEARRLALKHSIDAVFVDYLQLMDTGDRYNSRRVEEIGKLTRGLKRLAKDLNVPVVCLAQLNRGSENRPDKRPRLADLRDSGEIEQDADTVFMLHKPQEPDPHREVDELEWIIAKQRNGPTGTIIMRHQKRTFDIREEF